MAGACLCPHSLERTDEEERAFVAGACVRKLGIKYPAVLDEFGNSTEQAYTGWPDRIYLLEPGGRIAYKSKPGPFGFSADQLGKELAKVTAKPMTQTHVLQMNSVAPSSIGNLP